MIKRNVVFILFAIIGISLASVSGENCVVTELVKDNHFENGFRVIDPTHGTRIVEGHLNWDGKTRPAWDLAQWHSKFSIFGAEDQDPSCDVKQFFNEARGVTVCKLGCDKSDLILTMDSKPEYNGEFRKNGEPWPHLLVEQWISDSPSLDEMKELKFHLEAKLLDVENEMGQGYDPGIHTAQVPFVIVIQNYSKSSKGCGDFGWFIIPVYDARYRDWPEYIAQDKADPSSKMIYSPGSKAYGIKSLHDKKWVTVDLDILPILLEGMKEAWRRGYLSDSQDLKDYRISSINMGWEMPGLCKASIQIRNLSMKAVTEVKLK